MRVVVSGETGAGKTTLRAGDDERAAARHPDRRDRGHPRAQPRRRPARAPTRCSSGRPARRTSRASARSPSASSSATPCASTRDWLIVGEVRDGDAAREMLLAMQHGHPSLSTVHHHSALSAWKKLAQYVAQGSRGGRVLDRRPADLRRRRLLRPPRPRPPGSAGRHRDLRGRRLERRRGPAQPHLRRRSRRPRPAPAAPVRPAPQPSCATPASRTTSCSTRPGGGRRDASPLVGGAARRRLRRRRLRRRRRLAAACSTGLAVPGGRRPIADRRRPADAARSSLAVARRWPWPGGGRGGRRRWPRARSLGWLVPSFVGLRARRRRQLARSEAMAIWAEMLRDLLVSNAGLHEAIGKSARVAPAGDPRRGARRSTCGPSAAT